MTPPDSQDHPPEPRPPVVPGRTRIVVALLGLLLSLGVPVVVLGAPGLIVDERAVRAPDDPAGLGITGALSVDPVTSDAVPGEGVVPGGMPGDSASTGYPGIPTPNLPDGPLGIPGAVLDAYQFAERTLAATRSGCHLSWSVLAGIGRIESDHASDGRVDAFGNTLGPILGPRLDGSPGMAAIADTDRGQVDGDTVWDRAVGPMQFIPSSWRSYGVDGNGDGVANPNNIYDSTIATGIYLCAGGTDLSDPTQLQAAVFRYNHSATYADVVLRWAQAYLTGVVPTPSAPGPVPPGTTGNGGRPVVPDGALLTAPAPVAVAQPTPLASTPPAATSSSPPPPQPSETPTPPSKTTTTLPPTTTDPATSSPPSETSTIPPSEATPSPSPTATTPSASSPPPSVTPSATESPSPSPVITTPPATTSSPPASGIVSGVAAGGSSL